MSCWSAITGGISVRWCAHYPAPEWKDHDWREEFRPNFAIGYDKQGNDLGHDMRQSVQSTGSMDTTISDFSAFLAGVLAGEGITDDARAEMLGMQVQITARHQFPIQFPVDTDSNEDIRLVNELLGNTGLPWEWEGYVPYDHS